MGVVLSYLKDLKLTAQSWLVLSLSALIGLLVVLLRVQGSRLHRTQVELLGAQLKAREDQDDAAVEEARKRYAAALKRYKEGV